MGAGSHIALGEIIVAICGQTCSGKSKFFEIMKVIATDRIPQEQSLRLGFLCS